MTMTHSHQTPAGFYHPGGTHYCQCALTLYTPKTSTATTTQARWVQGVPYSKPLAMQSSAVCVHSSQQPPPTNNVCEACMMLLAPRAITTGRQRPPLMRGGKKYGGGGTGANAVQGPLNQRALSSQRCTIPLYVVLLLSIGGYPLLGKHITQAMALQVGMCVPLTKQGTPTSQHAQHKWWPKRTRPRRGPEW